MILIDTFGFPDPEEGGEGVVLVCAGIIVLIVGLAMALSVTSGVSL